MFAKRILVGAAAVVMGMTASLRAAAFEPAHVPAAAKWVLHLDADATRASNVWKTVEPRLAKTKQYDDLVRYAKALAGMEFPRDLHGVTLYGTAFGEESAVVVVHADADQSRLKDMLELANEVGTSTHAGSAIYSWNDEKGRQFGAFASPQRFVIARSEANVKLGMDVLARQAPGLAADAALAAAERKADVLMYVAGVDLQDLAKMGAAQSPLTGNVKHAWLSFSSDEANVTVRGAVTATTPETATQLRQALEGVKAIALLSAGNEQLGENERAAAQTMGSLTSEIDGSTVKLNWPVPMTVVQQLIEQAMSKQAATAGDKKSE